MERNNIKNSPGLNYGKPKKRRNDASIPHAAIDQARRTFSQAVYLQDDEADHGRYEAGGGASVTVPDQGYTVQELFERSRSGLTIPGSKPVYSDDDLPAFEKMDFADRMEFLQNIREHRREIEAQYKLDEAAAAKAADQAALEKAEAEEQRLLEKLAKKQKGVTDASKD